MLLRVLRAGLTGGIGSGKSEVARRLAGHGALIIDADKIAREVVEPGSEGLAEIVEAFGEGVLGPGGALDRERLGEIVFSDDEKRAVLNAIVHPRVGARTRELEREAAPDAIVVYDIPLLVENDLAPLYDVVIVVDADERTRLDRLVRLRGMSEADAKARVAAQATRQQRLAAADIVIDNSGALDTLDAKVDEVWARLMRSHRNNARRS